MRPTTDMRPSLSSGTRHPEQEVAHFSISTQRWPTFRLARPAAGPFDTFDRSNYLDKNASVATISVGSMVPFSLDKHSPTPSAHGGGGGGRNSRVSRIIQPCKPSLFGTRKSMCSARHPYHT